MPNCYHRSLAAVNSATLGLFDVLRELGFPTADDGGDRLELGRITATAPVLAAAPSGEFDLNVLTVERQR